MSDILIYAGLALMAAGGFILGVCIANIHANKELEKIRRHYGL